MRTAATDAVPGGVDEGAEPPLGSQASASSEPREVACKPGPAGGGTKDDLGNSDDEYDAGVASSSGGGAVAEHLFGELDECKVETISQHNGHDCGLYMLKYVEQISEHLPDLAKKAKKKDERRNSFRWHAKWGDHFQLCWPRSFWPASRCRSSYRCETPRCRLR